MTLKDYIEINEAFIKKVKKGENIYDIITLTMSDNVLRKLDGPRAVKLPNGKIVSLTNQSKIIHEDIVDILSDEGIIPKTYKRNWWLKFKSIEDFLCIEYVKGKWQISESYEFSKEEKKIVKESYKNVVITEM